MPSEGHAILADGAVQMGALVQMDAEVVVDGAVTSGGVGDHDGVIYEQMGG